MTQHSATMVGGPCDGEVATLTPGSYVWITKRSSCSNCGHPTSDEYEDHVYVRKWTPRGWYLQFVRTATSHRAARRETR